MQNGTTKMVDWTRGIATTSEKLVSQKIDGNSVSMSGFQAKVFSGLQYVLVSKIAKELP